MNKSASAAQPAVTGFHPLRLILVVFAILLVIMLASHWYANQVSLSRYCQHPELALQNLAAVITDGRPAGDGDRRDYIVAAKLEFLLPRNTGESVTAYLQRLRNRLGIQCR
jgi:hypothetical protein